MVAHFVRCAHTIGWESVVRVLLAVHARSVTSNVELVLIYRHHKPTVLITRCDRESSLKTKNDGSQSIDAQPVLNTRKDHSIREVNRDRPGIDRVDKENKTNTEGVHFGQQDRDQELDAKMKRRTTEEGVMKHQLLHKASVYMASVYFRFSFRFS